jgi:hypothetical protein
MPMRHLVIKIETKIAIWLLLFLRFETDPYSYKIAWYRQVNKNWTVVSTGFV